MVVFQAVYFYQSYACVGEFHLGSGERGLVGMHQNLHLIPFHIYPPIVGVKFGLGGKRQSAGTTKEKRDQQANNYFHGLIFSKVYPDLNGFEGWMDKKIDFQWIRCHLFS
jgi:hypothetical protein